MNDGQKQIDKWFKDKNWPYWTPHEILARVTEEVGELARLINHEYGPKKKKSDEAEQNIEDEIGDILYALSCMANIHDIDLDVALQKSINKVETRDKNRFKDA
jgi:NTP pyrophosphatase (non-canonical NTP hydrolase)